MYAVYALVDPRDNTVFYIGITDDVYTRFNQHINCSGSNFIKNARIMELRALNKMVVMETLEDVADREQAEEREAYWIKHFQMMKEPLMNISKMSLSRKDKKNNLRVGRQASIDFAHRHMEMSVLVTPPTAPKSVEVVHVSLTNAERTTILAAAQAQMKLTGKAKANRSQLIRDLNEVDKSWNNKAWDKVKIVLDEKGW